MRRQRRQFDWIGFLSENRNTRHFFSPSLYIGSDRESIDKKITHIHKIRIESN